MLGGTGELAEATKLALSYYAFVGVFASGLAVCSAILLVHALRLEGMLLFAAWACAVLLPFVVVSVRGFFATFSEYYGLSKKRLFIAGLGSLVLLTC